MTRDEQLIRAALEMASEKLKEHRDVFAGTCNRGLEAMDYSYELVRAIPVAEVLAKLGPNPQEGICDYRTEWHVTTATSGNELPGKPEYFGDFLSERAAHQALADEGFSNGQFGWSKDSCTSARISVRTVYSNHRPAELLAGLRAADNGGWNAGKTVHMTYRNYRGEVSQREIVPTRLWFGTTEWHPDLGWMLSAFDLGKRAHREFALADCQFKTENN